MTKLKLLSMAALLSAAIMSPVLGQQEPGAAAFYQSLGVGPITTRPRMRSLTPAISVCR